MMRERVLTGVVFLMIVSTHPVQSFGQDGEEGAPVLRAGSDALSKTVPINAMEDIPHPPTVRYNSLGRRDPFVSFVNPSDEVSKGLPPLQQVALSSIKLIGVAWGGTGYGAMLQTPDGKTYPVRKGVKVGTNQGRIRDIGPKEVIVEEPYLNIFGRSDLKQVVMKLYNKKEGIE